MSSYQNHHPGQDGKTAKKRKDPHAPFVNEYGVVIGDNFYNSPNSPLHHWSTEMDPAIMAGDEWVHPTRDIGWRTAANQELREQGLPPQGVPFMHPTHDVSYNAEDPEE
ncbi:DUF3905 domain-containing protein [Thermicanus aegyptius]|uniref:DUF3905 domain-containing protein n=1 Tax=Thermicanus aegyptius TaxID=94009 RepID=UPI000A065642|nr:DUF3905 domain-containing protein [Thermicanus aegyptius]